MKNSSIYFLDEILKYSLMKLMQQRKTQLCFENLQWEVEVSMHPHFSRLCYCGTVCPKQISPWRKNKITFNLELCSVLLY